MGDANKEYTQVLLPTAKVSLFSPNKDTIETFMELEQDWRFARVKLDTQKGNVESATSYFEEYESPELVIIETENIDDGFLESIEELGAHCTEGTAAIIIGPVNDVDLYRKLVGMGVSDYIVRPVSKGDLSDNIASTLLDKIGARDSRLVAFIGSKGGVGTSVLAQAMAWGMADKLKQKTFIMDTAAGWSSMSVGMDFEPTTTLAEATRAAVEEDDDSLSRMIHGASDLLTLLSTGGDTMLDDKVEAENLEALLDYIMVTYPVLIVDLSSSTAALKSTILTRAHEIILVATPALPSLRLARTLLHEIKELRGGEEDGIDLLINMQAFSSWALLARPYQAHQDQAPLQQRNQMSPLMLQGFLLPEP